MNCKLYVMWLGMSYCPPKICSLNWQSTPCLCTTTHLSPLQVIEFHRMMPFIIETPQLLAFWTCLAKFGWRFAISDWAFLLAKPLSQLLSLLKVYWKLPGTPALAEGWRYALFDVWQSEYWPCSQWELCDGYWYPLSEPQLSGTLQMEFLVCNDIGTSEHALSTKLDGYFGVLWAELSIWAAQWHFRAFGELILRQPSQQKLPFLSAPHSCTVLNFCQNALKT